MISLTWAVFAGGCHRSLESGRTLIDVPGTYECFDRQTIIKVWEAPKDRIQYRLARGKAEFGPAEPALRKAANWIIYAESPETVWVFDGDRELTRVDCKIDGGAKFTSSQIVPSLINEAPIALRDRLSASVHGG